MRFGALPRRRPLSVVFLAFAVVGGAALAGCTGPPREDVGPLVREYARAWSDRDAGALGDLTDAPRAAANAVTEYQRSLGTWDTAVRPVGGPSCGFGGCEQRLRVVQQIPDVGPWRYSTVVSLVSVDGEWRVGWAPANYHPRLTDGGELRVRPGPRTDRTTASLTTVDEQPLADTAQVPAPLRRLADRGGAVELVDSDGESETLYRPKRTEEQIALTLSNEAQLAAESALADLGGEGALVAIRPSTGEVLAAVGDDALGGEYEPGSAFSVVSAAALIDRGLDTAEQVTCPAEVSAGETAFRNPGGDSRAAAPFWEAFVWSCDTTIVGRSGSLHPGDLAAAAERFGIGVSWDLGVPAHSGYVPSDGEKGDRDTSADHGKSGKGGDDGVGGSADQRARIAASAIGRDGVTVSPLAMAAMVGTVSYGQPLRPSIMLEPAGADRVADGDQGVEPDAAARGAGLPTPGEGVLTRIRGLLRAGVTHGPAAGLRELGHDVHAHVGRTLDQRQEWVIGYQDDLAFAVLAPRDGIGVAKRFLEQYP